MAVRSSKDCPNCGSDHKSKPFCIYEDGFHCFSCGHTKRSQRDFVQTRTAVHADLEMPTIERVASNFSVALLKWLRSYHVTDELIYKYHIYESDNQSVILPTIINNEIVSYQQRWFSPRRIMSYGPKISHILSDKHDTIVIVEDFISAIRVHENNVDVCCMSGTNVKYDTLKQIVRDYNNIILWADGDAPGQRAANKLQTKITTLINKHNLYTAFDTNNNKDVRNILTEHDPKYYTNTQIQQIIKRGPICER